LGNSFSGGPVSGEVQKVDQTGAVIWDYVYSTTTYCCHHDIHPMPNGNVRVIAVAILDNNAAGTISSILPFNVPY